MSYCRWSTDKCRSDVYAYEAADGYIVHVRGKRPVNPEILPDLPWESLQDFVNLTQEKRIESIDTWQKEHKEATNVLVWEDIGLPYDDQTFGFGDAEGLYECLVKLRETGYYVPDSALEEIKDDQWPSMW